MTWNSDDNTLHLLAEVRALMKKLYHNLAQYGHESLLSTKNAVNSAPPGAYFFVAQGQERRAGRWGYITCKQHKWKSGNKHGGQN